MRVLVTSSRGWTFYEIIADALSECLANVPEGETMTVVHGGARGGDTISGDWAWWAHRRGLLVTPPEVHKAKWTDPCRDTCNPEHRRRDPRSGSMICPMAGYYRNEKMVGLGADVVLAFVLACEKARCREPKPHPTHGAGQCVRCALWAGLDVIPFAVGLPAESVVSVRSR